MIIFIVYCYSSRRRTIPSINTFISEFILNYFNIFLRSISFKNMLNALGEGTP